MGFIMGSFSEHYLAAIDDVDALGEHKPTPVSSLKGRERGGLGDFSSAKVVDTFPSIP